MDPLTVPPPGPPAAGTTASGATSKGITILVLGIAGLVCCQLTAPVAWVLGHGELEAIQRGAAPVANQSVAQIGMVLGILGTVLLAFGLLWVFAFGGLAALSILRNR
jgi:hypothetical protein